MRNSGMDPARRAIDELLEEALVSDSAAFDSVVRETPVAKLRLGAEAYGTPQYFLDVDQLRARAASFMSTMQRSIPKCSCCYAFKCNDLPLLVRILGSEGFQADVAGLFELQLALRLGFDTILFSSPGKSVDELRLALKQRHRVVINVDNMDELLTLRALTEGKRTRRKVRVGFRLSPETSRRPGQPWSKFGLSFDELDEAIRIVDGARGLAWAGLHIHTSWNKTPDRYVENIRRIAAFLKTRAAPDRVRALSFIDLGGGFYPEQQASLLKGEDKGILLELLASRLGDTNGPNPAADFEPHGFRVTPVSSLPAFAKAIGDAVRSELSPLNPDLVVYLEPGRYLATHPTTILLTVTAAKGDCVIMDGGINMLGDYKFSEYSFSPVVNLTRPSTELRRRVIYGPLCDPHDLWGYSHYGEELRKGDVVAVLHQGAYTFSTAWRFIKAVPQYVAFEGGRLSLAKKEERFRDRYAGCAF